MITQVTDDSHYLKYFFGLPFLEPENVIDCFTDDFMAIQPAENDLQIVKFTDYIFENYISPDAMFPPNIWAQFTASVNRTTNSCESFHSKLNMSFYTSHPNIYNFVDVLLQIQSETYIKFRSKSIRTKKICEKESFIREQMIKHERKETGNNISMALTNKLLLSQVAGYTIAAILSLCIIIPMSLHQDEFKGHCLLFSSGQWLEKNGQFLVNWASQAYCNYSIFVGVLLLVISSIQTYRMSIFAYKGTDSSFLLTFIDAITCVLMCIFTINAALMITFGFMTWCNDMIERFPSCEMAAGNPIDILDGIDTSGFYFQLGVAQFGIWASWSCWVGLTVCTMCKLCYYHQMSNMKASMLRERQKLIDEGMAAPTRVTTYTTQTDISDESNNSKIESQPTKTIDVKHIE